MGKPGKHKILADDYFTFDKVLLMQKNDKIIKTN